MKSLKEALIKKHASTSNNTNTVNLVNPGDEPKGGDIIVVGYERRGRCTNTENGIYNKSTGYIRYNIGSHIFSDFIDKYESSVPENHLVIYILYIFRQKRPIQVQGTIWNMSLDDLKKSKELVQVYENPEMAKKFDLI